jgi:uncharacterized protein
MAKPTFKLFSPETGTEYWIFVAKPRGRGPWPVVLFMDGDDQFAPAVKAYRSLKKGTVPPLLLVGVGYGASYTKPDNKRGRDYTPVRHALEPSSGGAAKFRAFLTQTLWPELGRRYRIASRPRGIAGHSLGALLVLDALFQTKPFFTHFLASAPSLWWANRAMLKQVQRLRARRATLAAKLFLAIGGKDSESMIADFASLEQLLAKKPFRQLERATHRLPNHDHYDSLPPAFGAGVKMLFGA